MNRVFIQANNKQEIGAKVAEFALKKNSKNPDNFSVTIINVDNNQAFKNFAGTTYKRWGKIVRNEGSDLQSFVLSRFMPPELMSYQGKAVAIDPDIFTLGDINDLFAIDMQGKAIAACRKKGGWDSSMMLLDCSKLNHWKVENIMSRLSNHEIDFDEVMYLKDENSVLELPRIWNNLDTLTPETKLLHTTNRLTQPWKTG